MACMKQCRVSKKTTKSGAKLEHPKKFRRISRGISYYTSLLDQGWRVNRVNERGFQALHYAAMECDPESIVYLLEKGAKITSLGRDKYYGYERQKLLPVECVFKTYGKAMWGHCGTGRVPRTCRKCLTAGCLQYPCKYCENQQFWNDSRQEGAIQCLRILIKHGADTKKLSILDCFWECPISLHKKLLESIDIKVQEVPRDIYFYVDRTYWEKYILLLPLYIQAGCQDADIILTVAILSMLRNNQKSYHLSCYAAPHRVPNLDFRGILTGNFTYSMYDSMLSEPIVNATKDLTKRIKHWRDELRASESSISDLPMMIYDSENEIPPNHIYWHNNHMTRNVIPLLYLCVHKVRCLLLAKNNQHSIIRTVRQMSLPHTIIDTLLLEAYSTTDDDERDVTKMLKLYN